MTTEEIKVILETPIAMFIIMLMASFVHAYQQKKGTGVGIGQYLSYLPETIAMVVTNSIFFAALIVFDQLNFGSALGCGYASNSLADLVRPGGRSASMSTLVALTEEKR